MTDYIRTKGIAYLEGPFKCDFCHTLSEKLAIIIMPKAHYHLCPKCLEKLKQALNTWYRWCNVPADELMKELDQ